MESLKKPCHVPLNGYGYGYLGRQMEAWTKKTAVKNSFHDYRSVISVCNGGYSGHSITAVILTVTIDIP